MSTRTIGRVIGMLFLSAFVLYGGGAALAGSASTVEAGAVLMVANCVAVATIGVLALRMLGTDAVPYLVGRVGEALLLAVGVVFVLLRAPVTDAAVDYSYQVAMLSLGIGSIPFCVALRRGGLVPYWLAMWGLVGYAVLALGAVAEILGYAVGVALSVPGGLFELTFGALLLVRGLPLRPGRGSRRPEPAGIASVA
ncbi:DUF4386 family protein [Virgisporangium aurantiacum]|uniref:DUF4386 domain-containing protein n=1 Tax=Virgisporangium aurantiacum TaxID=175570 RepID=A0A8J3Z100_9ACTN|nr:DUF4386 family protein [Virgisporangium aurantiacum]GIJ55471.1 hypothetical protein Vau01_029870 [Virgisporangium aurantiacum]